MGMMQVAGSLGVGAFLGALIFIMYRLDRKSSERRLSDLLEKDQETRQENTRALTELTAYLRGLNGHARR